MPIQSAILRQFIVSILVVAFADVHADPAANLRVETRPDGLAFQLTDLGGTGPRILQQSRDGKRWVDVGFWEDGEGGAAPPEIFLPWAIIAEPNTRAGLFRAVRLKDDDPFRRRFVAERTKWRLSGNHTYQYELSQNFGMVSWRGLVNVTDNEVSSFTTIDLWPPIFELPEIPSIDGLFDRIAIAIANEAHEINVSWDRENGAPLTGYIDLEEFLADEESGWSIHTFTPVP